MAETSFWRRTPPALFPATLGMFGLALAWRSAVDIGAPRLAADLTLGRPASGLAARSEEPGRLLRHWLAGHLDEDYRRALKVRREMQVPPGTSAPRAHLEAARRALLLDDDQIDAIYGRPASRAGYLARRLWRPFDLAGRLAASAWAAKRLGLRRGSRRTTHKGV